MKQRLAIASALIGNPEVLILDEPTNGLDPQGIAEIRNLVIKIANDGISVILASHLLDEVQKMCTHVAVLKKGKKLYSGPVDEVLAMSDTIELAANNLEILVNALIDFNGIKNLHKEGNLLVGRCIEGISASDVNEFLIEKGIVLSHLNLRKKSLEDQFLEILRQSK
jgi:ABC-2 type transport system ATP-binding protein